MLFGGSREIKMGKQFSVGCSVLNGINKAGVLKKDANGIYKDLVFGALDFGNSTGSIYTLESGVDMLRKGSLFRQWLEEGHAKGEYGHPERAPGMSDQDWFKRIMYTNEKNTCHQHMEMWIDMIKPYNHHSEVPAFIGDILPSGPYAETLERQLDSKGDNVSFSIRSITDDSYGRGGVHTKKILAANGFDYVTRPGLKVATKWNSPSLESNIDIGTLEQMLAGGCGGGIDISMEAANHYKSIIHSVMKQHETKVYVPASSKW